MKGGGGVHTRAASQGLASSRPILQRTSGGTSPPGPAGLQGWEVGSLWLQVFLVHGVDSSLGSLQATGGAHSPIKSSSCQWYPLLDTIQSKLLVRHSELFVV